MGKAQTGVRAFRGLDRNNVRHIVTGKVMERPAVEGESPVWENESQRAVSRVPRDTRNLVGIRGDHPPRLNTT